MHSGDSQSHICQTVLKPRLPRQDGAMQMGFELFEKVIINHKLIDQIISENAQNWDIERILKIDLIILRMAVCEFLHFEQVPPKATINEAIDLAKIFSTEDSKNFVNGVLDSIAFKLRKDGRLIKSGTGLQGWDEMVKHQDSQHQESQ